MSNREYAVAVRDADELLLFITIVRDSETDVYVNFPRDDPKWKPHASYHASGQHHQKSFGHKSLVYKRQKPEGSFRGTEPVVMIPIDLEGVRSLSKACRVEEFSDVLEIPADRLGPTLADSRTSLAIDLAEPGSPAFEAVPGGHIIAQWIFDDAVPYIYVTLWGESQ